MKPRAPDLPVMLGCPVWGCAEWGGQVYPEKTPRSQWLHWYSRTFNTVEGNSTFYAMPSLEATKRWASETADGFHFVLKFPRRISHEFELVGCDSETRTFLRCIEPLAEADRLGPTFLQLGPSFGPDRFDVLRRYLRELPGEFRWAVELRHLDWFDSADNEKRVNELLSESEIDKVLFDSRALFASPPNDEIEEISRTRKPRTPVRQTVTADRPILRLIGRNQVELVDSVVDQWAPIIAKWIHDGRKPYVFTHAPNDRFAPQFARRVCDRLRQQYPDAGWEIPTPPTAPKQLSLLADDSS